jgi:hypothetical protein
MRFALVAGILLSALACAEPRAPATPARAAPWVEFMRGTGITAWMDTSRLVGDPTGPIEVPLSVDYERPVPVTDDTAVRYTRMDWLIGLDCAAGRLQDRGVVLYDEAGHEVKNWPGDGAWVPIEGHATGTTAPWACRKLRQLGRQRPSA